MKRRLPPLNAVIAFETAARLKSFKKAGDTLFVTSSAISHQVRALEDWLGFKLFERTTRAIRLTDVGERYLAEVSMSLDHLENATRIETEWLRERTVIKLQTTDSLASYWLVPRLRNFYRLHPEITIQVITYDYREGFRTTEADLAILFNQNRLHHDNSLPLFSEKIFPVCSPSFLAKNKPTINRNLSRVNLIHDDNLGVSWRDWLKFAVSEFPQSIDIDTDAGHRFSHSHLALKAAEQGHGLALASSALITDALTENRLIAPFNSKLDAGGGYYLHQSDDITIKNRCRVFVDWLIAQTSIS